MDVIVLIISHLLLGIAVVSTVVVGFCWREYYVIYHHNLLYVIGLVFSRSLTDNAVIAVLMSYFTYYEEDLVRSAVLTNIQDGLSSILVIVMSNLADSFIGRYEAILFSNAAYIVGLWLMWMFNPYDAKWLVVIILVLLAFGTSGTNHVDDVLIDLVKDIDNSQDEERSNARAAFWCNVAKVSGAVSATFFVANGSIEGVVKDWRSTFLICIFFMTTTVVIFAIGYKVYPKDELIERLITIFLRECRGLFLKLFKSNRRHLASRHEPSLHDLETTSREEETQEDRASHTLRNEPSLHDLKPTTGEEDRQEDRAINYHEHDKEVRKSFFKIFPVWAAFLVVSLISATGKTFFFEQYNNLNNSKNIPIQIYNLSQACSIVSIPYLYPYLYRCTTCSHKNEKVKIGVGMVFSIICCLIAWQLEVNRLNKVRHLDDESTDTSISFLLLLPQFCVLGCMEGLTNEGLLRFFKSRMKDKKLKRYGGEYIELVTGFGKLLNIALILVFNYSKPGWFGEKINGSHLDKYYRILVYVCLVNFVYYCVIVSFWYKDAEETEDTAVID